MRSMPMLVGVALLAAVDAAAAPPSPVTGLKGVAGEWVFCPEYSDEFDGTRVDETRWMISNNLWPSEMTGSADRKMVSLRDGELLLRTVYAPFEAFGKTNYYRTAFVQLRMPVRYGYFEARMKVSMPNPGTCSAFWAYRREPGRWTEIDFIEHGMWPGRFWGDYGLERQIWHTLHVFAEPFAEGKRAQGYPKSVQSQCAQAVDADYRVIGCDWNERRIDFYVDGARAGSLPNVDHKQQALDIALSTALCTPYISTLRPRQQKMPEGEANYPPEKYPDADSPAFAPLTRVDYVRVWKRTPPPKVTITQPAEYAICPPGDIVIEADVQPGDHRVTKVEFHQDVLQWDHELSDVTEKRLLGSASAAPWRITWPNRPLGSYALRAIAYAADGSVVETRRTYVAVHHPLVAELPCDVLDGQTVPDASGLHHDFKVSGTCQIVPGRVDNAIAVSGGGMYLPGSDDDFDQRTCARRTISFWFNAKDTQREQMLATWGNHQNGLNAHLSRGKLVVGGWRIGFDKWDGTFLSTQAIKPNTWHHVAVVLDARPMVEYPQDSALRAYLDGQLVGQGPGMQFYGFKGGTVNVGFIGSSATSRGESGSLLSEGWAFEGMIDEVRLWNRALTDQEVRTEAGR